jgi:hypothetical protein
MTDLTMLARSPVTAGDVDRLIQDFKEAHSNAGAAVEAAIKNAFTIGYKAGWQAHAVALDAAAAQLRGTPPDADLTSDMAGDEPQSPDDDDTADTADAADAADAAVENETRPVVELPTPGSNPAFILGILKAHPQGLTSQEIIQIVRHSDRPNLGRAIIRTTLHRLKVNGDFVTSKYGKWFPANIGGENAGVSAPAQQGAQHAGKNMPP